MVVAIAIMFGIEPSLATKLVPMQNHTSDEIKSACGKAGGDYTETPDGGYGCSTNCHGGSGGDCIVACKKDHSCTGAVPGRAGPTASPLNVLRGSVRVRR